MTQSALPPLPYTLVDIDEPERGTISRIRGADTLQWKLWIVKYAWFLSLLTAAPGIALIVWVATANLLFAFGVTAIAIVIPGFVFWHRTRRLTGTS